MIKQLLIDKLSNEPNGARDYYLNDEERATIVECIKKQIPKKPNWQGDMMCMDAYCPNCGAYLDDGENPCEECHQLIDWSDNE